MVRRFFAFDIALLMAVLGTLAGLAVRFYEARRLALNPDEAWHTLFALQPALGQVWSEAIQDFHPPLPALLQWALGKWLLTEVGARVVPALAGSLAGLVAFVWLRRRAGLVAGAAAPVMIEFGPRFVSLSTQNRVYAVALFFLVAALDWLDRAAAQERPGRAYLVAGVMAALAAWSAFPVALLLPAMALQQAWRLWKEGAPRQAWLGWAGFVALVLGAYGALYVVQIEPLLAARGSQDTSWIPGAFPDGDPLYALRGFGYQFLYFAGAGASRSVWWAAAPVGLFGLALLWHQSWWPLALAPFAMATLAAYAGVFPYTATRHTFLLSVPIVVMLALLFARLVASPRVALAVLLPGAALWLALAPRDELDWPREWLVPAEHRGAARFVATAVPKMQPLLTTGEAFYSLSYYLAVDGGFAPVLTKGTWRFLTEAQLREAVSALRASAGLTPQQPVWLVEGVQQSIGARLKFETGPLRGAFYIYPLPAGY